MRTGPRAPEVLRGVLRGTWTLARPYWASDERWQAWLLLAALMAMNVGLVYLDVLFNQWNNVSDDGHLRAMLEAAGLPHLVSHLGEEAHWSQRLSPGEQQRIAFARAPAQRPDWLFLDEATSALDEAEEARLYALLRDWLPHTAVLSVGHRSTLWRFHARHWTIPPDAGSGARLGVADEPSEDRRETRLPVLDRELPGPRR